MDQRASYLLQILETIGSPLMSAITASASGSDSSDAQSMAALLAKTVEASIELGNIMDIHPAEAQDDTLRVALAGLSGPLVAGQFSKRGQVPEAPDIKKITGALQAVLTFSDNFTPTAETIERLKNLGAEGQAADMYQAQIQYMQAFIPVVEAVAAFPFGQAETKLIMDVCDRLVKKSVELREILLPGVGDEAIEKRVELGLLRALAKLYCACHKAETEKVFNMDEDMRSAGLSIDPVWTSFETRAAMLEILAAKMVPGLAASSGGQGSQAPGLNTPIPTQASTRAETPAQTPSAQPATPETPPAQTGQDGNQNAGANPMSMFAKPKEDGQAAPPAEQTPAPPPPVDRPAQETPPPPASEPPPVVVPVQPPPAPPEDSSGQSDDQGGNGGQGGNPMSFFKKGDE